MEWKERNELQYKVNQFDRIAKKIQYLEDAKSDLGINSCWKYIIKTQRTSDGGCIFSSELSDESEMKIREILQKEIETQIQELNKELKIL
jgi:hypothetical protein